MENINFACIGQFAVSTFLFTIGTAVLAMLGTDAKAEKEWFPAAWVIGILVYGITFVILYNR